MILLWFCSLICIHMTRCPDLLEISQIKISIEKTIFMELNFNVIGWTTSSFVFVHSWKQSNDIYTYLLFMYQKEMCIAIQQNPLYWKIKLLLFHCWRSKPLLKLFILGHFPVPTRKFTLVEKLRQRTISRWLIRIQFLSTRGWFHMRVKICK